MRFRRPLVLAAYAALLVSTVSACIHVGPRYPRHPRQTAIAPSRWTLQGDLLMSRPKGEFAEHVDDGYGGNLAVMFNLDRAGIVALRGDIGGLQYGSETVPIGGFPGTGRVGLEVRTTNNIFWGAIGPQVTFPVGFVRPYVNAQLGFLDLMTTSRVRGIDDYGDERSFGTTENADDATNAFMLGGGVYVPIGMRRTGLSLHVGGRYVFGGEATYLPEGGIQDNPDGSVTYFPVTSKTDQVMWMIGLSYNFPRSVGPRRRW